MNKFVQYFLCSRRSIASSLSAALFLALLAGASANAHAKTNHNAYVADDADGTVTVIDTRNNTVTAMISGFIRPSSLAVSPNGNLLYVLNNGTANLSVVDTETNTVTATIDVGFYLFNGGVGETGPSVTFSRRGDRAYLANFTQDTLVVINPGTSSVVATVSLPAQFQPVAVAVSPQGDKVYVGGSGGIMVVDVKGSAPIVDIAPTNSVFIDLVITPDGKKLYGSNAAAFSTPVGNLDLVVIDLTTNSVEDTIHLTPGLFVAGLAVAPDGRHVYVAGASFSSTVTVIDTVDNSIDATIIADGVTLTQLAFTPNGRKLLATNLHGPPGTPDNSVIVIDPRDNTLTTSIMVSRPFAIATQSPLRIRKDCDGDADDRNDRDDHHRRDHDADDCRDQDDHHGRDHDDDRDNDRDHTH